MKITKFEKLRDIVFAVTFVPFVLPAFALYGIRRTVRCRCNTAVPFLVAVWLHLCNIVQTVSTIRHPRCLV